MQTGIVLLLLLVSAQAEPDWRTDLASIKRAASSLRSIEARFVQYKSLDILEKPLQSKGRLYFQAPDCLRWEYEYPLPSVLIIKQGQVSRYLRHQGVYQADAAERIEAMRVVASEIQTWLLGQFDQSSLFRPSIGADQTVVLEPKNKSLRKFIQRIILVLDKKPGVITSIRIEENQKNQTRIDFFEVSLDHTIDPVLFQPPQ